MAHIAIAGASGFVGRNLVDVLSQHHTVRALGRQVAHAHASGQVTYQRADLFSAGSALSALAGVDVAVYLIHSMMPSSRLFQGDFHDTDLLLADNFANACATQGVKQIIYLGGLVPTGHISTHLQSRQEVESVLRASGVPVTVLRAGMIVGPGGSSFEILRSLVSRLPVMVLPQWTSNPTQTVFIDDVVRVIDASVLNNAFMNRTFDVVNGESLTYRGLLETTATVLGRKRWFVPVPVSSGAFSKRWVQFFGHTTYALVSPLIDSLQCAFPAMAPDPTIAPYVRFTHVADMVKETLRRTSGNTALVPKRRGGHEGNVRSVQRLPSVSHDAAWIAHEYMHWLPRFFRHLIHVDVAGDDVAFRITGVRQPVLTLRYMRESFEFERRKFHIVGGLLTKTTNTGWLEFRQVDHRKFTLVAVHAFVPSLPWILYLLIQAPLHRWVMHAFGRHLRASFSRETHS